MKGKKVRQKRTDEQRFEALTKSLKSHDKYMEEVDKDHEWASVEDAFLFEGEIEW